MPHIIDFVRWLFGACWPAGKPLVDAGGRYGTRLIDGTILFAPGLAVEPAVDSHGEQHFPRSRRWPTEKAQAPHLGMRGRPARFYSLGPVRAEALTMALLEADGTVRRFLLHVEQAREIAEAITIASGRAQAGPESHVQPSSVGGASQSAGLPAAGQEHAPIATASAAEVASS